MQKLPEKSIFKSVCLDPNYFHVTCSCFLFSYSAQNKEFVCRGHDYERLEAFQQRMLNEFPHAIAMQHANQPDETIFQAEAQCIHIITKPYSALTSSMLLKNVGTPIANFNHMVPPLK